MEPSAISIHAPAWGATWSGSTWWLLMAFQSTHPRGVRQKHCRRTSDRIQFQSTHPRGVRPRAPAYTGPSLHFNPRTRVGCDPAMAVCVSMACGFQSTHPRGVRRRKNMSNPVIYNFNPRTRVGCDGRQSPPAAPPHYFNPRTRVGCDPVIFCIPVVHGISIHAPAWGATANIHKSTLLFVLSIYLLHKHLSIFWRLSSLLFHSACPSYNFSVRTHRGISVRLDFAPP